MATKDCFSNIHGIIRNLFIKFFILVMMAGILAFDKGPDPNQIINDIRIERHKPVPMSDGVKLYADIYLPSAPGKYPTLVTRTPYGVQRDGVHEMMVKFAQHGYAVVVTDVRGRYESEGKWEPFRDEAKEAPSG
jgi:predicted acyl esterase